MNRRDSLQRAEGTTSKSLVTSRRRLGLAGRRGNLRCVWRARLGAERGAGEMRIFFQAPAGARDFVSRRRAHAHAYVQINIDLSSQTMTVHSVSGETYVWPISSGRTGHPTPRGVFRPRALYPMAYSPKYGNAPMPHSICLPWPICNSRHDRGGQSRPAGVARLRPAFAGQRRDAVRHGAAARRGNPHRRIAAERSGPQLNGAPNPHSRLRRSAIRGPSINGRAIRLRADRQAALHLRDALITRRYAPKFARLGIAFSFCLGYQANWIEPAKAV